MKEGRKVVDVSIRRAREEHSDVLYSMLHDNCMHYCIIK